MKKILAILLALTLVCGGAAYAIGGWFSMETGRDESTVTVCVTLNEDISAENATMLQGELYYDPEVLEPVAVTASDAYGFLNCVISERHPRIQFSFVDAFSEALALPAGTVITAEFEALVDTDAELCLEMNLQTADGTVVVDLTDYATVLYEGEPVQTNPFTDVKEGDYYFNSVLWAVEEGITYGTTETTFEPCGSLLRCQVVVMLWRAAGEPETHSLNNPFTDVKESDYFYQAVLWAVDEGITSGTSRTTFSPNETTKRSQVVTFLWRYMGKEETAAENPFADVDPNEWYGKPVLWALEKGITKGVSATEFGVNEVCNRSQMVTFLYRTMN